MPKKAQDILARDLYWGDDEMSDLTNQVDEPTEEFPQGIPAGGIVTISGEGTDQMLMPTLRVGDRELPLSPPRTTASFGRALGGLSGAESQRTAAAKLQSYRRFKIVNGHWIELQIVYSPTVKITEKLYEIIAPPSPIVTYENLPQSMLNEIEAARVKAMQDMKNRPTQPGGTPPP